MKRYNGKAMAVLLAILLLLQSFQGTVWAETDNGRKTVSTGVEYGDAVENIPQNANADFGGKVFHEVAAWEEEQYEQVISEEAKEKQNGIESADKDQIRVIVELQGEPIIEEAIRQGLSYADLSEQVIEKREREIVAEQTAVIEDLQGVQAFVQMASSGKQTMPMDIVPYKTGFNGLAMTIKADKVKEIEAKPYVKRVYRAEEYQRPQMKTSHQMIGSGFAWDTLGLKGEGMVVAVIDTGIDYTHSAMVLEDSIAVKYSRETMNRTIQENGLKGKYFTEKIPYGYNYYDHNTNTFDSYGSMHGMHVAGTVGANTKDGAQINGVAPNAQILALKVFSDDIQYPTTFTDVWLKALDDAIALKADVINMSLGAPAGLASEPSARPEDEALRRAKAAGIVVAVSAGNDGNIMTGNYHKDMALIENPDTGLIASPTLYESTISVASIENSIRHVTNLRYQTKDGEEKARINIRMGLNDDKIVTGSAVHIGFGDDEDYENQIVKDKIILLGLSAEPKNNDSHKQTKTASATAAEPADDDDHKHIMTLEERIRLAESKEPRAILLYNNQVGDESVGRDLNTMYPLFRKTLAVVGYSGGQKLIAELKVNPDLEVRLSSIAEIEPSPNQGRISAFTSWGPTPDLRIKPEVAAPGGNIYSTIEDNKYKTLSGTSMASPHVAGAAAILKQHLQNRGFSGEELAEEIKLRLMNTAKPIADKENKIEFVRRQGAGLMQLDRALKTEVSVKATGTNDGIADGKLELKELTDSRFQVSLQVKNESDRTKMYQISLLGIIEETENQRLLEKAENISDFGRFSKEITVSANSEENVNFQIDFSGYVQIRKDSFLEGYIFLKEVAGSSKEKTDLSVPFLAYYGDWSKPAAIDGFGISEAYALHLRNAQFIVNKNGNARSSAFMTPVGLGLPIINNTLYFLPDLDKKIPDNVYGSIGVRMAMLRNMSKIEYSILDAQTGKVLKVLGESWEVRKLNRLGQRNSFMYMPESFWRGDINGQQIKDEDTFLYQIKAILNNDVNAPATQIYQYHLKADTQLPVYADSEAEKPKVEDYKDIRKKVSFTVQDTGTGLDRIYLQSIHFRERAEDENGNHRVGTPEELGENPDINLWKPFYGKALKIAFVKGGQSTPEKPLLQVVDGKLTIPESYLPKNLAANAEVFCDINGHENKLIRVETYYDADEAYLGLFAVDHLANTAIRYVPTGAEPRYIIGFFNYFNQIKANKGKIWVNDQEIKDIETLVEGKTTVRMEFPEKNAKLKFLKVKINGEESILVEKGKEAPNIPKQFQFEAKDFRYRFTVEPKIGRVEVISAVEPVGYGLSFAGIDFGGFKEKKIQISTSGMLLQWITEGQEELDFPQDSTVNLAGALSNLQKRVEILLKRQKNDHETVVPEAIDALDYQDLDNVYLIDRGRLFVKLKLTDATKVIIRFHEDNGGFPDFFDHGEPQKKANEEKYPAIFLRSPNLLELKSSTDGKIAVDGFVGYAGEEGLESLTISLVDPHGNLLAKPIEYPLEQIVKTKVRYAPQNNVIYQGTGYEFALELPGIDFLTNIRVEAVAKNGKHGSITRRMYFDSQMPELVYAVDSRDLNDSNMRLHVSAKDDSFLIKIYQNGSYLGGKDLSKLSLESKQVSHSQTWEIPLEIGQNQIELKVVDAARKERVKTLYIYRSEQ